MRPGRSEILLCEFAGSPKSVVIAVSQEPTSLTDGSIVPTDFADTASAQAGALYVSVGGNGGTTESQVKVLAELVASRLEE